MSGEKLSDRLWRALTLLCVAGAVVCYVVRSFHPEQPLHHELNEAAGVFLVAALLTWLVSS